MPELFHVEHVAKVRCFGRAAALDGLTQPAGTLCGRIAPDEVVFVGAPGTAAALVEDLEAQLAQEGTAALVVDHTDGWGFVSLAGKGLEEVWARVSAVRLPDADPSGATCFTVGKVCDVAAKVFVRPGRVDVMYGAEVRRHVGDRFEHVGHAVGLHTVRAPKDDPVGVRAAGSEVPA